MIPTTRRVRAARSAGSLKVLRISGGVLELLVMLVFVGLVEV